jgi:hypothetical protein
MEIAAEVVRRVHGFSDGFSLTRANGVAFTGECKLWFERQLATNWKAEAALSDIGFAGRASRVSGAHWSVRVTHRFLRRGTFVKIVSAGIKCQHSQRLQSRRSKNDPLYLVQIPVVAAPVIEKAT